MCAKLSNAVGEEKALERQQIGCMSGVLHFFDRRCRRRLVAKRRLPPSPSPSPGSAISNDKNQIQSATQIISECPPRNSSAQNRTGDTEQVRSIVKDSINEELRSPSMKTSPTPVLHADRVPLSRVIARRNSSEVPRFSCDGREISRTKTAKIKELPRLSLDSSSIRSSNLDSRRKEPDGSPNQRAPSVVAKLMGLAETPNSGFQDSMTSTKKDTSKGSDSFCKESAKNRLHIVKARKLEFGESHEVDIRARKHMVGTLQAKRNYSSNIHTPHISATRRAYESRILIMKRMKSISRVEEIEDPSGLRRVRTGAAASRKQAKDQAKEATSPRKTRTPPPMQRSPRPQLGARQRNASPVKASSPRVQKRETESEKKPRPPTRRQPASTSGKNSLKPDQKNSAGVASEDVLVAERAVVTSEQPSPISVLDSSFYYEDTSPSPVNRNTSAPKPMESFTMRLCEDSPSDSSADAEPWELGNIKSLLWALKLLSSTGDEESQQPALDLVFEIVAAKASPESRKLMLDVVQEILLRKLELLRHGPQLDLFARAAQEVGRKFLLRELLSEMKRLENDRAMPGEDSLPRQAGGWENFGGLEVPGLVVEIERLIFKDLIDDVVTGEANTKQRRRQLFT